jgi:hypothetical protein
MHGSQIGGHGGLPFSPSPQAVAWSRRVENERMAKEIKQHLFSILNESREVLGKSQDICHGGRPNLRHLTMAPEGFSTRMHGSQIGGHGGLPFSPSLQAVAWSRRVENERMAKEIKQHLFSSQSCSELDKLTWDLNQLESTMSQILGGLGILLATTAMDRLLWSSGNARMTKIFVGPKAVLGSLTKEYMLTHGGPVALHGFGYPRLVLFWV